MLNWIISVGHKTRPIFRHGKIQTALKEPAEVILWNIEVVPIKNVF